MLYLLLGFALAAGIVVYLINKGKIKDSDGDFIPDAVEEKVANAKKVVKKTASKAKQLKGDVSDIIEEVKDVVEEIKEVKDVIKKKTQRRKSSNRKSNGAQRRVTKGKDSATLRIDKE